MGGVEEGRDGARQRIASDTALTPIPRGTGIGLSANFIFPFPTVTERPAMMPIVAPAMTSLR